MCSVYICPSLLWDDFQWVTCGLKSVVSFLYSCNERLQMKWRLRTMTNADIRLMLRGAAVFSVIQSETSDEMKVNVSMSGYSRCLFYLSRGASSVSLQWCWWWCLRLCRLTSVILSGTERSHLSSCCDEFGCLPSRCSYRRVYTCSGTQTWCWNEAGLCLDLWWWCTADHLTKTQSAQTLWTHTTAEHLALTHLTCHIEFLDGRGEDSRLAVGRRADERFYSDGCRWSHDQLVSRYRQWKSIRGPAVCTGRPADSRTSEALRAVDG